MTMEGNSPRGDNKGVFATDERLVMDVQTAALQLEQPPAKTTESGALGSEEYENSLEIHYSNEPKTLFLLTPELEGRRYWQLIEETAEQMGVTIQRFDSVADSMLALASVIKERLERLERGIVVEEADFSAPLGLIDTKNQVYHTPEEYKLRANEQFYYVAKQGIGRDEGLYSDLVIFHKEDGTGLADFWEVITTLTRTMDEDKDETRAETA